MRGAWSALIGVAAVYLYAMVDRHLMSLLVEPLRADLGITDTQFSLAHGSGFALALGLASIPAGRLVDRGGRVRVLAAAVALWSVMTVLTGLANGFVALIVCRMGVALGQAALNPATYALIADRFPPKRLGLALGIFGMAPHLGIGIANLVAAGLIATVPPAGVSLPVLGLVQPWQVAFAAIGLPGLLIAVLVTNLSEQPYPRVVRTALPPLGAVVSYFRRNLHSFAFLKLATGLAAMAIHATGAWAATLLIRTHGWSIAEAGSALGALYMIAGALGALSGGILGDWLLRYWPDGRIVAMMIATLMAIPFGALAPIQPDPLVGLALLAATLLLASMAIAINPAATMAIMPVRMRGVATALGVLIVNLVGLGCGPLAVAVITDFALGDPGAIGVALSIVVAISLAASTASLALCRITYTRTLTALQSELRRSA